MKNKNNHWSLSELNSIKFVVFNVVAIKKDAIDAIASNGLASKFSGIDFDGADGAMMYGQVFCPEFLAEDCLSKDNATSILDVSDDHLRSHAGMLKEGSFCMRCDALRSLANGILDWHNGIPLANAISPSGVKTTGVHLVGAKQSCDFALDLLSDMEMGRVLAVDGTDIACTKYDEYLVMVEVDVPEETLARDNVCSRARVAS